MRSPSCLCVCVSSYQLLNALTSLYETWYVYHGTLAHLTYVLHKSLPSVFVSVCVSLLSLHGNGFVKCIYFFGSRQRFGKHVLAASNISNNRRIVGRVIFCAIRVLSNVSL
jgi:hypothetical protein